MSDRAVKWGILTNGAVWRLYWQDARSRAEMLVVMVLTRYAIGESNRAMI